MSKRKTLDERIEHRGKRASWTVRGLIVAELDRLARQVKQLKRESILAGDFNYAIDKTIELIREAKR